MWAIARDEQRSDDERHRALGQLVCEPSEQAAPATYVVRELNRESCPLRWREAFVFLAEQIHFPPELRPIVGERLAQLAQEWRWEVIVEHRAVWAAVRRAASLLRPSGADWLIPLMSAEGAVDTRAVALKSVGRVCEPAPPDAVPQTLAQRAYDLALKFLAPDVFAGGDASQVARMAGAISAGHADDAYLPQADGVAWLELTVQEKEALADWLTEVDQEPRPTGPIANFRTYTVAPSCQRHHDEDGVRLYRRFSCSGVVLHAYTDGARIPLMPTDETTLPPVNWDTLGC